MTLKISSTTIKFEGEWVNVSHSVGESGDVHHNSLNYSFVSFVAIGDINNSAVQPPNPLGVLVFISELNTLNLLHNFQHDISWDNQPLSGRT